MDPQLTFHQYVAQHDPNWWKKDEDYRRQFYQDYLKAQNAEVVVPDRSFAATLKGLLNWDQTVAAGDSIRGLGKTVYASLSPLQDPRMGDAAPQPNIAVQTPLLATPPLNLIQTPGEPTGSQAKQDVQAALANSGIKAPSYDPQETWASYVQKVDPRWWQKDENYQLQFRKNFLATKGLNDQIVLSPDQAAVLKQALETDSVHQSELALADQYYTFRDWANQKYPSWQGNPESTAQAYNEYWIARRENRPDVINSKQLPDETSLALQRIDSQIRDQIRQSPKYASVFGVTALETETPVSQNAKNQSFAQYASSVNPDWVNKGKDYQHVLYDQWVKLHFGADTAAPVAVQPINRQTMTVTGLAANVQEGSRISLQEYSSRIGADLARARYQRGLDNQYRLAEQGMQFNAPLGAPEGTAEAEFDLNDQLRPLNADLTTPILSLDAVAVKVTQPGKGQPAKNLTAATVAAAKRNRQLKLEARRQKLLQDLADAQINFAASQTQNQKVLADPGLKNQGVLIRDINARYNAYLRVTQARLKNGQFDENTRIMSAAAYIKSVYPGGLNSGNGHSGPSIRSSANAGTTPVLNPKGNPSKAEYQAAAEIAIRKNHSIAGAIASLAKSGSKPGNPVIEELVKRYNVFHNSRKKVTNYTSQQYFDKFVR